ncbi:MAG: GNAT family N-acetyltransferase [Oscillospiraceae bacterium]|nr:GNAT family N-acetyltransferase [Oscillospiraceae bacterium]
MEQFFLEQPSLRRREAIVDYLHEFVACGSEINGSGSLDKIFSGFSFEQALERCLRMEDPAYAASIDHCPGRTFLLIRAGDDRLIGTINVRWNLSETMLRWAGHIGYGIRPSERRKGYAKLQLYAGLKEAQKLGLERVMLGCSTDNPASEKTIRALGGVFERMGVDPQDGEESLVFWIDVERSLETCRALYEPFLGG